MSGNHEIDTLSMQAYERSVAAEKLVAQGRVDEGRELMAAAAKLDLTYSVRAEFIGKVDRRRVEVSRTVRRTLVPFLSAAGFGVKGGGAWSEGEFLERSGEGGVDDAVLIGRSKFGHRLGILAARRYRSGVEYFDWKGIGLRSGRLAYATQQELEAACGRWQELISMHVFPWWDEAGGTRPAQAMEPRR